MTIHTALPGPSISLLAPASEANASVQKFCCFWPCLEAFKPGAAVCPHARLEIRNVPEQVQNHLSEMFLSKSKITSRQPLERQVVPFPDGLDTSSRNMILLCISCMVSNLDPCALAIG